MQLSNNGTTVEKIKDTSVASAIGTKGFSSGVHRWDVRIDKVSQYSGNTGHYILFGVIEKDKFNGGNDYGSSFSASSYKGNYNMCGVSTYMGDGKVYNVTLNCDEGTLTIKGEGVDMKATGLKGLVLYPYFYLYVGGNKLTVFPK